MLKIRSAIHHLTCEYKYFCKLNMVCDEEGTMTDDVNSIEPILTEDAPVQKPKPATKRYFVIKIIYKAALIFLGYAISYMQWSLVLLFVAAGTLIWLENRDSSNAGKIKAKAAACSFSKQDIVRKIDEIPSWVKFPDRERAEWLNQVIAQLWPTINNYVVKIFRNSIQGNIRKKYESFRFESIDFGCTPPKIDGIKVYNSASTRDSIIVDFDVFYDGNCDINFSISGAEVGGLRDFQLSVEVRVVLKPLLPKVPLIGGVQIYFLNAPDINFTLEGLSSIPGLSTFLRSKIEEKIIKKIVFPNKITKRFSKSVEPSELKSLEPAGVLRVHVFEAKDLMAKDITGKSDPYAILYVGAQERRTQTISQSLNPKWDYWCEFVVVDPISQHLGFKLYDHDNVNEDDFLGSGEIEIASVIKGDVDQWLLLDNAKHGSLHLRFTWLSLSSDMEQLVAITEEARLLRVNSISTAVLIVYVDMGINIPEAKNFVKPNPYFVLKLGDQKEKSRVKKHTVDPIWEQGFVFLVADPNTDSLHMTIIDKTTANVLTQFSYKISSLTLEPNIQVSKKEFPLNNEGSKIILSLQLKILANDSFEIEDDETDSDSDAVLTRENSLSTASIRSRSSIRNSPKKEIVEDPFQFSKISTDGSVPQSPIKRTSSTAAGEYGLGKIELTIDYSEPRQRLLVTIHQISNLPLRDPTDIPDPYVKIKFLSNGHSCGPSNRTKIKMDCCNPVYEETFEYVVSKAEAYEQQLLITVKTKKKLFGDSTMSQAEINLKYVNLSETHRAWIDLCPKN